MLAGQRLGEDRGELVLLARRPISAARSFQGTTTVAAAALAGTPGLAGSAPVARPEPACASSPSTWPW